MKESLASKDVVQAYYSILKFVLGILSAHQLQFSDYDASTLIKRGVISLAALVRHENGLFYNTFKRKKVC